MHLLAKRLGRAAMVVKSFQINEYANPQVKIVARKAGLISWMMALLGVNPTYTLWVYQDRLESLEESLSGKIKTVIPLSALDTYTNGFTKPAILVVLALIFAIIPIILLVLFNSGSFLNQYKENQVFSAARFSWILALFFALAYKLQKCLLLSFTTKGANGIYFLFKRSVIEGVAVDETFADMVTGIVQHNYIAQVRK